MVASPPPRIVDRRAADAWVRLRAKRLSIIWFAAGSNRGIRVQHDCCDETLCLRAGAGP